MLRVTDPRAVPTTSERLGKFDAAEPNQDIRKFGTLTTRRHLPQVDLPELLSGGTSK